MQSLSWSYQRVESEVFQQWLDQLAYLHGSAAGSCKPIATATFRQVPEHFKVVEQLQPPSADEAGEHQWLWVRKRGANTQFVAEEIAAFAGVSPRQVSYAGLKDRHAETWQWFSIQLPGQGLLAWHDLKHDEFVVEQALLQPKKLRLGFHSGNRFQIRLTDVAAMDDLLTRWEQVTAVGFPNYFGEQRFGRDGANLVKARRWFEAGRKFRVNRNQQSFLLSSVRSYLFNQVVSARIAAQRLQPEVGDVLMLAGSRSIFRAETIDAELIERFQSGDVQLTGPLAGAEKQQDTSPIAQFEREQIEDFWLEGLRQQRVDAARRLLFAKPLDAVCTPIDDTTVDLSFTLESGAFATSLMREIVQLSNASSTAQIEQSAMNKMTKGSTT